MSIYKIYIYIHVKAHCIRNIGFSPKHRVLPRSPYSTMIHVNLSELLRFLWIKKQVWKNPFYRPVLTHYLGDETRGFTKTQGFPNTYRTRTKPVLYLHCPLQYSFKMGLGPSRKPVFSTGDPFWQQFGAKHRVFHKPQVSPENIGFSSSPLSLTGLVDQGMLLPSMCLVSLGFEIR